MGLVMGMSVTHLVVASVSALLILGLAVVGVAVCTYRQGPAPAHAAPMDTSSACEYLLSHQETFSIALLCV